MIILLPMIMVNLQAKQPDNNSNKKDSSRLNELLKELKTGENNVQEKAAWALGDLESRLAVPALIEALKDDGANVRAMAAWALGEIKDQKSLESLIEALADKNDYAREMIIKAVADRRSGKLLGVQILGENGVDKRMDVFVALMSTGATVDEFFHLDFAYAPPFSTTKREIKCKQSFVMQLSKKTSSMRSSKIS